MKNLIKALTTLCLSIVLASCSVSKVAKNKIESKPYKVLLVGIDPSQLDFTKINNLTEKQLSDALEMQKQKLIAQGYDAKWCLVDLGQTAEKTLKTVLTAKNYDLVLIGAGIRTLPENFLLFENVINVVHEFAPNSKITFNTNPNDSEEAVKRRLKL